MAKGKERGDGEVDGVKGEREGWGERKGGWGGRGV